MRFTIIILLLLSLGQIKAQNSTEEHYQFDSIYKTIEGYYNRGLNFKAAELPKSLEENRYVDASAHFFFARVYSLSNEFSKTLFSLKNAVERGITKEQIEQMYDLDPFRKSNLNVIFESSYPTWHQVYLDKQKDIKLDSVYMNELIEITEWESDYEVKTWYDQDGNVAFIEDSSMIELNRKQQDSVFYFTMELVLEKGFPIRKRVGELFNYYSRRLGYSLPKDFSLDDKKWKKIKKMIFTEMEKGNIKPFYYAVLEDDIRASRNQSQLYGTWSAIYSNSFDVAAEVLFENPEEINVRRKAVGLCPIQVELWSQARELPESLKGIEFK
ncbi:MAG: hypothetical protein P8Q14_02730 [Vicingaceae bacterium]|nr:hypothetical protein [Vicingaceae bacterium]